MNEHAEFYELCRAFFERQSSTVLGEFEESVMSIAMNAFLDVSEQRWNQFMWMASQGQVRDMLEGLKDDQG